jgi:hypothetical protein
MLSVSELSSLTGIACARRGRDYSNAHRALVQGTRHSACQDLTPGLTNPHGPIDEGNAGSDDNRYGTEFPRERSRSLRERVRPSCDAVLNRI